MKVSSVDENDQSTDINALSLNRFHTSEGTRRKYDGQIRQLPSDSIDSGDSIDGFTKILDQSLWTRKMRRADRHERVGQATFRHAASQINRCYRWLRGICRYDAHCTDFS
ncbi:MULTISPECIES: hypothetical protein [unclassified Mesorhizobium]|uniref:hypothetical protein n=1 Tax=unclassified Mesorhizobium TaxID=325217 RepID=UPI001ABFC133|nr:MULTISPECIES: hypothetical protein [unclassified Mesorhizobium]